MKKLIISLAFAFVVTSAQAQIFSPNIGVKWDLDSLVLYSGGVVSQVGSEYHINNSITLMLNDTFVVNTNEVIRVADTAEIVLEGVVQLNSPDSLVITAMDSSANFPAIEIRNSSTVFQNVVLSYGGGIGIYDSSPLLSSCTLKNNKNGTRGAVNLFNSNAVIEYCNFYDNYSSAISGGANIANAPQILHNHISGNVTYNGNRTQISLGASGTDTSIIFGNHIEGLYTQAGAISVLSIGTSNIIIDSNLIEGNRYGVGMIAGDINSIITNNIIRDNDIQGDPMLGGSGLNFNGTSANTSVVSYNEIYGNLWGVTIQGSAKPNLGDMRSGTYNVGQNEIYNNFNSSAGSLQEYAIFNNTPDSIWAQNNIWHQLDSAGVESIISHQVDNSGLGYVTFMPIDIISAIDERQAVSNVNLYPNPAVENFIFDASSMKIDLEVTIFDITGKEIKNFVVNAAQKQKVEVESLNPGIYFISWIENNHLFNKKMILR